MGRNRSGFTLYELLIVLSIAGILLTMAMSVHGQGRVVDSAARELESLLLAAQNRAVLSQRDVTVRFDTAAGVVTVMESAEAGGERHTGSWAAPDGVRFGRGPAAALRIGGAAATFRATGDEPPHLVFRRSGSTSEWGGLYLSTNRAGQGYPEEVRALEVDRGTGHVIRWRHGHAGWVQS